MQIKPLEQTNLSAVCKIETAAQISPWTLSHFESSLRTTHHHCYGIFDNEKLLGFIIYSVVLDEIELLNICVDPAYHGKGVGQQLLDKLLQENSTTQVEADFNEGSSFSIKTIFLEVHASNTKAIRFYQKNGFEQHAIRKAYYQTSTDREDAILMKRR
jgi:ribosomal-protein-alanine N-acetyltransferase